MGGKQNFSTKGTFSKSSRTNNMLGRHGADNVGSTAQVPSSFGKQNFSTKGTFGKSSRKKKVRFCTKKQSPVLFHPLLQTSDIRLPGVSNIAGVFRSVLGGPK